MKKIFISFLFVTRAIFSMGAAVTYTLNGGRLGDSLLCYLHAKWLAYKEGVPLVYHPFALSSALVLDDVESRAIPFQAGYSRIDLSRVRSIQTPQLGPVLYVCPYFPEAPQELHSFRWAAALQPDWKDPSFREIALAMIAPKQTQTLRLLSPGAVHIALHFREGGGYDSSRMRQILPLKLPPFHFYLDGLLTMLDLFPTKQLECHVFTDAKDPGLFVEQLREALPPKAPIQFVYRAGINRFDQHVLEDFYSLFLFDVLIRPQSNFSIIPSLLKDFAVVYSPKACSVKQGIIYIDDVFLDIEPVLYDKLLIKK